MRGAVSDGRLVNVPALVFTTVMTTGTSPAPASVAGRVTVISSKPGGVDGPIVIGLVAGSAVEMMSVVPMRTVMVAFDVAMLRTPVTMKSSFVATVSVVATVQSPFVGLDEVTANGSPVPSTHGFVTLSAAARPPGPFVEVKMSGCAKSKTSDVRMSAPLLLMTTGAAVAEVLSPFGTTKLIRPGETK